MAPNDEPSRTGGYDPLHTGTFHTKTRSTSRTSSDAGRLYLPAFLLGIVAVIALVFSAIALSRPGTTSVKLDGSGTADPSGDNKIWVFAIGHDDKTNLEYIDKISGTVRGFHVDVVEAVCSIANKNCRLMWDVYENCYTSKAGERPRPGVGLMGGWYDGCTGWAATYDRMSSLSFTKPFLKSAPGTFYVKRGNPRRFNSSDLTGKTIGFMDGFSATEFCLYRAGFTEEDLPAENIRHYTSRGSLIKAVNDELVDAIFASTSFFDLKSDLEVAAGDPITTCILGGAGIMVRKDSRLPDWWNPAFDQLKLSTGYEKICSEVTQTHDNSNKEVDCIE